MDTHLECGGLVSGYSLPMGSDEEGQMPDGQVLICHRCGDWVTTAQCTDDGEYDE